MKPSPFPGPEIMMPIRRALNTPAGHGRSPDLHPAEGGEAGSTKPEIQKLVVMLGLRLVCDS